MPQQREDDRGGGGHHEHPRRQQERRCLRKDERARDHQRRDDQPVQRDHDIGLGGRQRDQLQLGPRGVAKHRLDRFRSAKLLLFRQGRGCILGDAFDHRVTCPPPGLLLSSGPSRFPFRLFMKDYDTGAAIFHEAGRFGLWSAKRRRDGACAPRLEKVPAPATRPRIAQAETEDSERLKSGRRMASGGRSDPRQGRNRQIFPKIIVQFQSQLHLFADSKF